MKKRIIIYIAIFQVILIGVLISEIFYKSKGRVLGEVSVNKLSNNQYSFNAQKDLKHFYEPKPGVIEVQVGWINTNGPQNPVYHVNSDGLNQLMEITVTKPSKVFRIITLGDSFTSGDYVNTEDNYPSQLQQLLSEQCAGGEFEVLNLGVSGYDIRYAVERYKLKGQKYSPDLILWLIIDDDFRRINELLSPLFSEQQRTLGTKEEDDKDSSNNLFNKTKDLVEKQLGGEENILNLQKEYLEDLGKYYNKDLVLITFPQSLQKNKQILKDFVSTNPKYKYYDGIPDIYTIAKGNLPDYHPSPLGYKLIAENIFGYLTSQNIIPCK